MRGTEAICLLFAPSHCTVMSVRLHPCTSPPGPASSPHPHPSLLLLLCTLVSSPQGLEAVVSRPVVIRRLQVIRRVHTQLELPAGEAIVLFFFFLQTTRGQILQEYRKIKKVSLSLAVGAVGNSPSGHPSALQLSCRIVIHF